MQRACGPWLRSVTAVTLSGARLGGGRSGARPTWALSAALLSRLLAASGPRGPARVSELKWLPLYNGDINGREWGSGKNHIMLRTSRFLFWFSFFTLNGGEYGCHLSPFSPPQQPARGHAPHPRVVKMALPPQLNSSSQLSGTATRTLVTLPCDLAPATPFLCDSPFLAQRPR